MEGNKNIFAIKSSFILKKIFAFTITVKKLELSKYNKKLQNKFGIDIEIYKKRSNRYRIIEKNGTGIEYSKDTNKIIFEGNYLNGERNGKGKEYYENGNIKFKGEYSNDYLINGFGYDIYKNQILFLNGGKGKEYFANGKIKFEGEYFKGRKWHGIFYNTEGKKEFEIKYGQGKVKEYNLFGKLLFEGEYNNGKKHKGIEYDKNGEILFVGEYLDGKKLYDKGIEYNENNDLKFKGKYLNGKQVNLTNFKDYLY